MKKTRTPRSFVITFALLCMGMMISLNGDFLRGGSAAPANHPLTETRLTAARLRTALAAALKNPDVGYTPRASGFDLDDDGIVGEPEDCRVCNGQQLDIDNDGVIEDQLYVDADNGNDVTGDGTPGNPYQTIRKAWSLADGPGDGAEDIICFRGVAREENLQPGVSGVSGAYTKAKTGSEAIDWEFPKDPTMLVGWDYDGDGVYPPFDADDIAVLDGANLKRAFTLNTSNNPRSFIELAHFSVRDYGYQTAADGSGNVNDGIGFLFAGRSGSNSSTHIYLHDLELSNINRGKPLNTNTAAFNFFVATLNLKHFAVANIKAEDTGGYFARGDFGDSASVIDGPLRFQKISYTARGCDYGVPPCGTHAHWSTPTGFKLWGMVSGIEVLDNLLDANVQNWNPRPGPVNAIIPDGCSVDWTIRNNILLNWKNNVSVKGAPSFCKVRAVDNVLVEGNVFYNNINHYPVKPAGIQIGYEPDSTTITSSVNNVTVINNFIVGDFGLRYCLYSEAANGQGTSPGTIVFRGNVCDFNGSTSTGTVAHLTASDAYPLQNFVFADNVLAGLPVRPNNRNFFSDYAVTNWQATNNIYSPGLFFERLGALFTLTNWQNTFGYETTSRECSATVTGTHETGFVVTLPPGCN